MCHFGRGLGISCKSFPRSSMESQSVVHLGAWNNPFKALWESSCIAGRFFRSDADVVGTPPGEDCFSFYGKAM